MVGQVQVQRRNNVFYLESVALKLPIGGRHHQETFEPKDTELTPYQNLYGQTASESFSTKQIPTLIRASSPIYRVYQGK